MTNTINYTHEFQNLDSELVYDVWYDVRDSKAYVNLHDNVYEYSDVLLSDVEDMVEASSIGRAYNGSFMNKGFKQKFGPGENLGRANHLRYVKREPAMAPGGFVSAPGVVPKNLTYADDALVVNEGTTGNTSGNSLAFTPNKTVPLRPVAESKPASTQRTMTVHFESNGSKTYTTEAGSVDEAVAGLDEVADMLGVRVDVTGVFVHLG